MRLWEASRLFRGTLETERKSEADFYTKLTEDYPIGSNTVFDSISDITSEKTRLDNIVQSLRTAEQTHQTEIAEKNAFFDSTANPPGAGSAFANVGEIEAEVTRLENIAKTLEGSAKDEMTEAADELKLLVEQANGLEGDITTAKVCSTNSLSMVKALSLQMRVIFSLLFQIWRKQKQMLKVIQGM